MRRLLLLLLTFLLPLQLLAATVSDLPPRAGQGNGMCTAHGAHAPASAAVIGQAADALQFAEAKPAGNQSSGQMTGPSLSDRQAYADAGDAGAGQNGDEDEADASSAVQAEFEDHTLPARIATPDIPWQPFPHAFSAPLSWPSFVRDQQRPPPLA